ncbi:glutamate racemase [Iodobacter ciconiae]|uniref:Glutamate racemase n=1 Tax=Iodobacter ciconiae TaxID=2496266 RepID=A0A3S8ZNX0_9NEIS|nr:glutamate racemase [Iodobacter ciconiae]AZN35051.1 glutamate racemase [Iodobacter ciconiae]
MQNQSLPSHPIGVFDSGVGGLTVVRALMDRLPFENIIYFGDTARVPYGVKSVDTIAHFTQEIAQFLQNQQVKMLIIACNTMAAVAADLVRDSANVPVLDVIEAGAKNAVDVSWTGGIGVIGTPATINSNAYARAIHQLNPGYRVYSQACPLFVPLVEEGWLDHPVTKLTAQEYLKPVFVEKIDTLVLGCTHYPLIKPLLLDVVGGRMKLVDSALSIADQAADLLQSSGMANPSHQAPDYRFYVTDVPVKFQSIGERFLGRSLNKIERVNL